LPRLAPNAGKSSKADDEYGKALALRQKLADNNPAVARFQRELAENLTDIGSRLDQTGKTEEALGYCTRAEATRRKLAAANPATAADMDQLANCLTYKAECLRHSGKLDLALAACEDALAVLEPLLKAHPEVPDYRVHHSETNLRLRQVLCDMKSLSGAAAAWKRACERYSESPGPSSAGPQAALPAWRHMTFSGYKAFSS
jgi:tetratricopeptide (TPR) repeat protein